MPQKAKLTGSVNLLAEAMRRVFSEAVEEATAPLTSDMKAVRADMKAVRVEMKDMETRLNKRIDTINQNMAAQFAEQEKKIGKLLRDRG